MIIVAIIVVLISFPVLWVVFTPVNARVNTVTGLYEIRQAGTVAVSWHPGETPLVRMYLLGHAINIQRGDRKVSERKESGLRRDRKGKSIRAWLNLFRGITRSFRCRRFVCNIDFDDVVLNAQLFPLGYFISRGSLVMNVNFERKYLLDVWVQFYAHRMLWPFMRFYLTK